MSAILTPQNATPRCTAQVDLLSRVMRPYLFRVIVMGEYPHAYREVYTIRADSDNSAAIKGMEEFCRKYGRRLPGGVASVAPKAGLA